MLCPECSTEAAIMESGYEVIGDDSPLAKTQLFAVVKFHCRNPQCRRCGKEIGSERTEITVKSDAETSKRLDI